ncbi:hypothetical protein [Streptacidiphilus cavernicola]|uniref:Uncharacterized protein n=1 Tax=Streptacidiphilus cavernicola TaxID=3342716 RepID=A0ABV6W2Z7_9ACTN
MTTDQVVLVTESEPTDPEPMRSMMEFLVAAAEAGIGDGIRSISPIRRSNEAEAFIRTSLYPSALHLITDLLRAHAAKLPKQQTGDLLRALAGGTGSVGGES